MTVLYPIGFWRDRQASKAVTLTAALVALVVGLVGVGPPVGAVDDPNHFSGTGILVFGTDVAEDCSNFTYGSISQGPTSPLAFRADYSIEYSNGSGTLILCGWLTGDSCNFVGSGQGQLDSFSHTKPWAVSDLAIKQVPGQPVLQLEGLLTRNDRTSGFRAALYANNGALISCLSRDRHIHASTILGAFGA